MALKKVKEEAVNEFIPDIVDLETNSNVDTDMIDKKFVENLQTVPPIPDKLSPEWSDYLMTQFHPSEVCKIKEEKWGKQVESNYPRVHGLRRLAQIYVGRIIDSIAVCIQAPQVVSVDSPNAAGPGMSPATFLYTIKFETNEGYTVTYSDVADCFHYDMSFCNSDREMVVYPSAIAVTRAEARCLRKALGLVVCSLEELGPRKKINTLQTERIVNVDEVEPVTINDGQVLFIDKHCQRLNIHPWKFLKTCGQFKSLKDVSYQDAVKACKRVGDLIRQTNAKEDAVNNYQKTTKSDLGKYSSKWQQEIV